MQRIIGSLLLGVALTAPTACRTGYNFDAYQTDDALFTASLNALKDGRSGFAVAGFERLTLRLGARDSLLPLSYYYLGKAQVAEDNLTAASEALVRVHALFPADSLADDALLEAARVQRRLWKNPELDPAYGEQARATLHLLLENYPSTSLREAVFEELKALDELFAAKDLEIARDYYRDSHFIGAIIYTKQVVDKNPSTDGARKARVLMARSYQQLGWKDNVAEVCSLMRDLYPGDRDVKELCGVPAGRTGPPSR